MEIKVIASTKQIADLKIDADLNEELYVLGGRMAGVCYAPDDYFDSKIQNVESAIKRSDNCCTSGHHSPFDHAYVTIQITGIPKILAMLLNSTEFYNTSEKSARYTIMKSLDEKEQKLYDKWRIIFNYEIRKKYGDKLTEKEADRLAIENARYMLSVFTPTSMCYTTSYRQYNYLIKWLDDFSNYIKSYIEDEFRMSTKTGRFYSKLYMPVIELKKKLEDIFTIKIKDNKNGRFQFFRQPEIDSTAQEYYGDVYLTHYSVSFAALAQLQRHRTIHYEMELIDPLDCCFLPPILTGELISDWFIDFHSIADNFPQCMLVNVTESGRFSNFVLKCKERLCTRAQLEIFLQTRDTMKNFIVYKNNLSYPSYELLDSVTDDWCVVPRCMFDDFKCTEPCKLGPNHCFNRDI